jgi:hypothetical protein
MTASLSSNECTWNSVQDKSDTQVVPMNGIFRPNMSIKATLVVTSDDDEDDGNLSVGMGDLPTNVFRRTIHYARVWFRMCWLLRNW